jgi:hypothetical protein
LKSAEPAILHAVGTVGSRPALAKEAPTRNQIDRSPLLVFCHMIRFVAKPKTGVMAAWPGATTIGSKAGEPATADQGGLVVLSKPG